MSVFNTIKEVGLGTIGAIAGGAATIADAAGDQFARTAGIIDRDALRLELAGIRSEFGSRVYSPSADRIELHIQNIERICGITTSNETGVAPPSAGSAGVPHHTI